MAETVTPDVELNCVEAPLNYLVDTGVKPVSYLYLPVTDPKRTVGEYRFYDVTIRDGRPIADSFALEREGFVFRRHDTKVTDFFDADQRRDIYGPEIEKLVLEVSGAKRVVVFDHTVRTQSEITREEKGVREPVPMVHNDYTDKSAAQRVRDMLPADEAEDLLSRRFGVIQVWRPIRWKVQNLPLAICDAQTMMPEEIFASDLIYRDRVGETMRMTYSPDHRWYYFPDMDPGEAMVFKTYESERDGRSRFTAHTAFTDPNSPADAPPRESIESRAFAFY
ncbi:MAG: CmcJ/NvfI family oxidoreductase [Proteobacteria bacterium]|nr:CmcJ/NvfI family oxidoreductase [Pseudomonadota bacterium]